MTPIPSSHSEEIDFWDYSDDLTCVQVLSPNAIHFNIDDGGCLSEDEHETMYCPSTACEQFSDSETSPTACSTASLDYIEDDLRRGGTSCFEALLILNSTLLTMSLCGALITSL